MSCLRSGLSRCANYYCTCNLGHAFTEECERTCGGDGQIPRGKGGGNRNSLLGRVMWCLGRQQGVRTAIEFFMGSGDGSTIMVVAGMAQAAAYRGTPSRFITFEADPEKVRELFSAVPGLVVKDDIDNFVYPMPLTASEQFDVEVGRIRRSLIFGDNGLEFFVCGDQILKGAALNAVQIGELQLKRS